MRLHPIGLAAGMFALTLPLGSALAGAGALTQLADTDACVSNSGSGGDCADGVALRRARGVAVSGDGKNVYTAAQLFADGGVAVFARDRRTGALRQLAGADACVSKNGNGGDCADGVGLEGAINVAVSHDGRNVYVVATGTSAVAAFKRDKRTGALRQLAGTDACISFTGDGGACTIGVELKVPVDLAVSRDGKNVYVGSDVGGVAVFARDRRTGALRQLAGTDGCISGDGSGGNCADGVAVRDVEGIAVSDDGKNVYAVTKTSDSVAVFRRDRRTGALRQLAGTDGCISEDGSGGDCADGVALDDPQAVAVSRDGRNVYVASDRSDAIAAFAREKRRRRHRR